MRRHLLCHSYAALFVCLAWPAFAQDPPAGSRWLAEEIGGARVIDLTQSRLEVMAGGRLSGNSGCNAFTGAGELIGGIVNIGQLATTRMACQPAIMEQEGRFLEALGKAVAFEKSPSGGMILRDRGGTELVRFKRL